MSNQKLNVEVGSGKTAVVKECQICHSRDLESILFLGYLPPVNTMPPLGERPKEQSSYPAELLRCTQCQLFQLGLVVDPAILFPPEYPYTSGTTKILRENFAELYREVQSLCPVNSDDLIIDIGSNDGTLLGNFRDGGHRVQGIEPTNAGKLAQSRGIRTLISFFNQDAVQKVKSSEGQAKIVTAANVFAHMDAIGGVIEGILDLLQPEGIFISESHYLPSLIETLQYDTIYHEHLRYYSLTALNYLFQQHGLEIIHAKRIPTHGGSIRVYTSRRGKYPVQSPVAAILKAESELFRPQRLREFARAVSRSKLDLLALLRDVRARGERVYAIGAPSRASTLVNYTGLDEGILDCVLEIPGSYKIGKYMPGTLIPVLSEEKLFQDQPENALLLSWHIADELMPKLREKGFRGNFIVPLPHPQVHPGVVRNAKVINLRKRGG